jgi:integrin alpha FG-GAP repeat containing protein 1
LIQTQNYLFYEGVIPNSQLIFIPYQPDGVEDPSTYVLFCLAHLYASTTNPNAFFYRWKVELYIQPADYIPWVFVTLAGAAAILATVVATLNWMEKREDRLERRKALHIVNFDAL